MMKDVESEAAKKGNGGAPGIQFGRLLIVRDKVVKGPNGVDLTLAAACEIALDTSIRADDGEGLKPKLRRGRLIEQIAEATESMQMLALEAEDIKLIKDRVGAVFGAASVVRGICLLLDPASKE